MKVSMPVKVVIHSGGSINELSLSTYNPSYQPLMYPSYYRYFSRKLDVPKSPGNFLVVTVCIEWCGHGKSNELEDVVEGCG